VNYNSGPGSQQNIQVAAGKGDAVKSILKQIGKVIGKVATIGSKTKVSIPPKIVGQAGP
jgi:hypothetical protein